MTAVCLAAVLLAGGESRRMGGLDKRLLEIDGTALVRRWPTLFAQAGISETVVVIGHDAARVEAMIADQPVRRVLHADWARGQQGSVRAGLAALSPTPEAVMIVLCDLALIDAADLLWLIDVYANRPAGCEIVVPVRDGQRGNPVVVSRSVVDAVMRDDRDAGLRAYIDAHPDAVLRAPAPNDHFVIDIDTPEDLARLEARLGRPIGRAG